LLAIARTTALDWFRADARRRRREERAEVAESRREDEGGFGEGLSPVLEESLRALSAGEREVVALRIVLDASLEVRSAVVLASAIVMLVFLPVFFLPGLAGAFFRPLAAAYVLAVAGFIVAALFAGAATLRRRTP